MIAQRVWITWPARVRPRTFPGDQYMCWRCRIASRAEAVVPVARRIRLRRWRPKTTVTAFQHRNRCPAAWEGLVEDDGRWRRS